MSGFTRGKNGGRQAVERLPPHASGITHSDGRYIRGSITSDGSPPKFRTKGVAMSFTFFDKLRLIGEWSPVLTIVQDYVAENDSQRRALIVMDALEFLASKTETKVDDGLVKRLDAVLRTPQGEDLLRYVLAEVAKRTEEAK